MTGLDGPWLAENRREEESGLAGEWRLVRPRLGHPDGARRGEEPWVREGTGGEGPGRAGREEGEGQ